MLLFTNFIVDLVILAAFLVAFEPNLTGIPIHEWFSLVLTGMIIVHLLLHWNWMVLVTVRFFKKLFHKSRIDYLVDALLFVAFTLAILSGLLISESVVVFFGLHPSHAPIWLELHVLSANLTLLLTGLHFALHWKWLVNTFSRTVLSPLARFLGRSTNLPGPAHASQKKEQPLR